MALVKTSKISAIEPKPLTAGPAPAPRQKPASRGTEARPEKLAERIAAATEELASGLAEASAAAEELKIAVRGIDKARAGREIVADDR